METKKGQLIDYQIAPSESSDQLKKDMYRKKSNGLLFITIIRPHMIWLNIIIYFIHEGFFHFY